MPWDWGDSIGQVNYMEKADGLRRISLQNSQYFPETEVKRVMLKRSRRPTVFSNEGSALLDYEVDEYYEDDEDLDESEPLMTNIRDIIVYLRSRKFVRFVRTLYEVRTFCTNFGILNQLWQAMIFLISYLFLIF